MDETVRLQSEAVEKIDAARITGEVSTTVSVKPEINDLTLQVFAAIDLQ